MQPQVASFLVPLFQDEYFRKLGLASCRLKAQLQRANAQACREAGDVEAALCADAKAAQAEADIAYVTREREEAAEAEADEQVAQMTGQSATTLPGRCTGYGLTA